MPWRAKESTTAGAPTALKERNCCAGMCIGFSCCKEYIKNYSLGDYSCTIRG